MPRLPADQAKAAQPYRDHALAYFDAGWSPLPMRTDKKVPYVSGHHGRTGTRPTRGQVIDWRIKYPYANVALRLPPDFVGIDVDAYGGRRGEQTLAQLEKECGPLPPAWTSTARSDGVSGVRLYRCLPDLDWLSVAGPGIDIIHAGNRYVMVPPSVHPVLLVPYRWIGPDATEHTIEQFLAATL